MNRLAEQSTGYARALLEKIIENREVIERSSSRQGPFDALRIQFLDTSPGKPAVHLWYLLVPNDKTGSLYVIFAESPVMSWDSEWPVLKPILANLGLDDQE